MTDSKSSGGKRIAWTDHVDSFGQPLLSDEIPPVCYASAMMDQYLLQNCSGGYVGNSPVFWREGGSGYTPWIDEAKRWTKEDAELYIRSTRGTHSWQMWSVAEIESVAKRTVDIQDLRKLVEASA